MAPMYDTRDSEPSDDSSEALDDLGDLFNENKASPDDIKASGSSDHVQGLQSMDSSGTKDADSTEMIDTQIDQLSVEPMETNSADLNHDYGHSSHSVDRNVTIDFRDKGDGDKLKGLEALIDSGINPDLVQKLIEEVIAFSTTTVNAASGSSDHVQGLQSMDSSGTKDADSTEMIDTQIDQLSVEPMETNSADLNHDYGHSSHSVDRNVTIDFRDKGDGDKLKGLEALIDSGINPDLVQKLIEEVIAFSTTTVNAERSHTVVDNCVGEKRMPDFPRPGEKKSKSQTDSSKCGGKRNKVPNSTVEVAKFTPTTCNTLETMGKFVSENGEEHIEKHGNKSSKIPQLGFSARLMHGNVELVIYSKGCLLVSDDNFVAKVSLDQPQLLNDTRDFRHAAGVLLGQLRIDQVLLDGVTAARDKHRELFLTRLEHVIKQMAADEAQVNTRIELLKFVERSKQRRSLTYVDLCREVTNNQFHCEVLQKHARVLEEVEHKASQREQLFRRFKLYAEDQSKHLLNRLDNLLRQIVEIHKDTLLAKAPSYLHRPLNNFSKEHLMLISSSDVKLFTDMSSVLRADVFEKPLQDLAKRWINRVMSINVGRLNKPLQLTSVIFFYLCKSLEEVIVEITECTDHRATDLLKSSNLGWRPIKNLVWKSESALTKCLQREYYFIFLLLKHFEVTSNFGRQPFQYEMQLFNSGQSSSRSILSGVKNALVRTRRAFGFGRPEPNPLGVPDDFYVWYCLLDDVLFHVLPNGCEIDMFDNVFEGYVQMIRDAKYDQMETLRVVTHNLARYIAQSCSYGARTPLTASLDKAVLRKQLDIFSFTTNQNVDASKNFRDQVDVFNSFWKTRNDIIDQFPTKIDLPEMNLMQGSLMEIMLIVLDKDVEVDTRVAFFRTYNDFLIDLNEVSFDWYIKDIPEVDMEPVINLGNVELVDNKWKDTNNRTYRVVDPKNFSAFMLTLDKKSDVPKHYVIEVIQALLEHIGSQLQRTHWLDDENLSVTDQVVSTNELICAIRNSLLYLKEQIDYVSFDLFFDERVKPFASVLESATSRQDFSNRINLIKESFWYIRKQNEISLEDALRLYDELNSSHDSQLLRESYAKYSKFFEEFMQLTVDEDYSERASLIVKKVKVLLSNPTQFKTWDDRFKQDEVPQILAGLGAVWSILVSKDVAKAGKYFNPHCIQILCVLRLLSVDKAGPGIDKHLAQVLTGQGKSLVLGLLAALFALTGHRVRIACYSEYLAQRDEQDFLTFYEMFDVAEDITYGTFDDLANGIIKPTVDGQAFELRHLVEDLLFKGKVILPHRLVTADSSNDVLLMDEVDVFFTKEYYGSTYNAGCFPLIPGLDLIQEQIWKYVIAGWTDVENRIQQYIQSAEFKQRGEFLEFLERPNCYTICENGKTLKDYTNKTLFDEHVRLMVGNAKYVHLQPANWVKYRLNSKGVITCNKQGVYVNGWFHGYENVFNYFRLKKENFVTQVGWNKNYGYLNIGCGSLSYAMLPKNYPGIVGVSGTLTSLNQYEKDTIERLYNIKQTSLMPTFFGCSNLQFDEVANFHHHATKSSWRTNIFSHANQMIAANRAVIVFFKTDVELHAFEAEYAGQLDRMNVLTENTEDKERFISEAGVAKTITLATRGMGRGVDYKSSVTVEKNGGVHVIQTFLSMDVKEETQIKGRTARKDNKGSYELIVYDKDLRSCKLMDDLNNVTYAELDAARGKISLDANAELSRKIREGMDAHHNTMNYMRSFFKN